MTDTSLRAPLEYDLFSHAVQENPYPIYEWLFAQGPVYRNERRDFYALTRYEDVVGALRDWQRFSSSAGVRPDDLLELQGPSIIAMDPPRHRELRQVVLPAFLAQAVARLEPLVARKAMRLLHGTELTEDFDIVEAFARRLPVLVIGELMGLPEQDAEMLKRWADEIVECTAEDGTTSDVARVAGTSLREYFSEQLADRRQRPRDDLISALVTVPDGGDPLSPDEAVGMCNLMFEAGNATTSSLIANSLCTLFANPAERGWLIENPGAIAQAVEELLRYESPVQNLSRVLTEAVSIHGVVLPAGSTLVLVLGAANSDPGVWEAPNELRLSRELRRNVAFGSGLHHCIGAPLARLEGRVALSLLLSRMPAYEIVEAERFHDVNLRMLKRLVVRPGVGKA